jgi:hypothetical protein
MNLRAENGAQFFLQPIDYGKLEGCFFDAYENHKSASVALHMMGVDTGFTLTYSIQGSSINFQDASYSANFGGSHQSVTGSCSKMVERLGGIVITCSNGDTLYSPSSSPEVSNNQI